MATRLVNRRSLTCAVLALVVAGLPLAAQERHRARNRARGERGPLRALASELVNGSLSLSKETDPVRKAQILDQLAAALADRAKVQAGSGGEASAEKLAVCSSRLIEEGVVGNIEKAAEAADARGESAQALLDDVTKCLDTLQGVADRLPEGGRERVTKCIETCRQRGQGAAERLRRRVRRRYGRASMGAGTTDPDREGGKGQGKGGGQGPPPWAGKKQEGETRDGDQPGAGPRRRRGRERGARSDDGQ